MFEVSSLRTNTSSKSFAPLINSHVDSQLFKAAPNFNQILLQSSMVWIFLWYTRRCMTTQIS